MLTFRNEDLTAKTEEDLGVDITGRAFLPFPDLEQSVRDGVETLRRSELIPKTTHKPPVRSTMYKAASSGR